MKNIKDRTELDEFLDVDPESGKRKNRLLAKKDKVRVLGEVAEEEKPLIRPKIKNLRTSHGDDEWDDDDEALFEWRRRGMMDGQESDDELESEEVE